MWGPHHTVPCALTRSSPMALWRLSLTQDSWVPLAFENSECAKGAHPLEGNKTMHVNETLGLRCKPGLRLRGEAVNRPPSVRVHRRARLGANRKPRQVSRNPAATEEKHVCLTLSASPDFDRGRQAGPAATVTGSRVDSFFQHKRKMNLTVADDAVTPPSSLSVMRVFSVTRHCASRLTASELTCKCPKEPKCCAWSSG